MLVCQKGTLPAPAVAATAPLPGTHLPRGKQRERPLPSAGTHHKTSDLVGAGEEARRVGIHLLVLQPWGRAVGGLPTQGLPEAVCEGRPHQLPTDTTLPPPALLFRPWDKPCPSTTNCSQSAACISKSQGAKEGRGLRDSTVMKQRPREGRLGSGHTARTTSCLRLTTAPRDGDNYPRSTYEVAEAQRG